MTSATETKKSTKRTAANTPFLARVKAKFNAPIYKETLRRYNEQGEQAAREYVAIFYNGEI